MQLVMRRERLDRGMKPFKINARMVLYEDEKELLNKYRLHDVVLTPGHRARDIRRAILLAFFATFVIANVGTPLIIGTTGTLPPVQQWISFLLLCFVGLSYLIFHQIREEVHVKDLITGRDFKAKSFLDLLQKEHSIRKMSVVFQKVVDQARTWHEPEVIELQDQPLPTVLEGYREAA